MKKPALMFAALLVCWLLAPPAASAEAGVSFGVFYSSLGSHGEWLHVDGGVYAWRPHAVEREWRPYWRGHWLWTDDGWYWASDEPWGWATYHYGRWYYDDYYGWVWIPGYDWAPAWVEWRFGGGCMGWAPLGPYAVWRAGWGIYYSHYWTTPGRYWNFVDCGYVTNERMRDHVYRESENPRMIGRTRGAGSVRYDAGRLVTRGPERGYVERTGNIRVGRTDVVDVNERPSERVIRSAEGHERVEVYRPRLDVGAVRAEPLRPDRVREADRAFSLDVRNTDLARRGLPPEQGRDLRRAEEYRMQRLNRDAIQPMQPSTRSMDAPTVVPDRRVRTGETPRSAREREIESVPERRRQPIDRPPRFSREIQRSAPPERTMRRPDWNSGREGRSFERPHVESAPRGGSGGGNSSSGGSSSGGNRGGGGGSSRGGSRR